MLHTHTSTATNLLDESANINDDTEDFISRETRGVSSAPNEHILHAAGRSFQDMSDNTYGAEEDDVRNAANTRGGDDIGIGYTGHSVAGPGSVDHRHHLQNQTAAGGAASGSSGAGGQFASMLASERKTRDALQHRISGLTGDLKRTSRILDKERLLHRYERLNGSSSIPPEIGSMSAETLLRRVEALQAQRRGRFMIKVMRRMLCFGARLAELVASVVDKNSRFINLKGWCDSFTQSVGEYDHLLYDVYDYYLVDIEANPIMMLLYGVASNAAMYSMRQKFLQNPVLNAVRQAMYHQQQEPQPRASSRNNQKSSSDNKHNHHHIDDDGESSNASVHIDKALEREREREEEEESNDKDRFGEGRGMLTGIPEEADDDDEDALSLETRS